MKVIIELTETEVKGLKSYLKAVSSDISPCIKKEDIRAEIAGIVSVALQSGAVYDHIKKYLP